MIIILIIAFSFLLGAIFCMCQTGNSGVVGTPAPLAARSGGGGGTVM